MKFAKKILTIIALVITSSVVTSSLKKDDPLLLPAEIKTNPEPLSKNGPPNFDDKKIHLYKDQFNPSNLKEITPEYPEYDVLPSVDHFNVGVVNMKKRIEDVKEITKSSTRKNYEVEFDSLLKELYDGDKQKLKKVREENSAYDANWLRHQLKISRIIELDEIINKKKKEQKEKK